MAAVSALANTPAANYAVENVAASDVNMQIAGDMAKETELAMA